MTRIVIDFSNINPKISHVRRRGVCHSDSLLASVNNEHTVKKAESQTPSRNFQTFFSTFFQPLFFVLMFSHQKQLTNLCLSLSHTTYTSTHLHILYMHIYTHIYTHTHKVTEIVEYSRVSVQKIDKQRKHATSSKCS
jgi:hypothetical protein